MTAHKMYAELAQWWPLLSPLEHYEEEAEFFMTALRDAGMPEGGTLLELGSGGGSNAFYLKTHFRLTLVDLSEGMLEVSRAVNPECEHHTGDMRTVRLGQAFDGVFIHDAIDYMLSEADLRQAFETAFVHCRPGGVAVFVPDHLRDTFEASSEHGGEDGDGRGLRYMEWMFDPDPSDSTCITHYVFMLREGNQVHVEHDEHECGLFARADWMQWLREAGFVPACRVDAHNRDVFVALKPAVG